MKNMFSSANLLGHASARMIVEEDDHEKASVTFAHV